LGALQIQTALLAGRHEQIKHNRYPMLSEPKYQHLSLCIWVTATATDIRHGLVASVHEVAALQRRLVVISTVLGSLSQLDCWATYFLVWDRVQDVRDAVEPSAPLVI